MSFGTENLKQKFARELEVCLSPLLLKSRSTGLATALLWWQVLGFPNKFLRFGDKETELFKETHFAVTEAKLWNSA